MSIISIQCSIDFSQTNVDSTDKQSNKSLPRVAKHIYMNNILYAFVICLFAFSIQSKWFCFDSHDIQPKIHKSAEKYSESIIEMLTENGNLNAAPAECANDDDNNYINSYDGDNTTKKNLDYE